MSFINSSDATNGDPASLNISAVSIKLPQFWRSQSLTWFIQAEAQFALKGIISDQTMYYHVVCSLDQETAERISDFLSNPPKKNMYESLKNRLLNTFEKSEFERAACLMNITGLENRKPSELMDEMLSLLGNNEPCFIFKYIFLSHLPEDIRLSLSSNIPSDPRDLALLADRLWISKYSSHVNYSLNYVTQKRKKYPVKSNINKICYYHKKFGKLANKCVEPCSFSGKENADQQ